VTERKRQSLDLADLPGSWELALRAERKSKNTIISYTVGVRLFLAWCQKQGISPSLDRDVVRAWVADLLDSGQEAATVVTRQMAVRLFSAWLTEEGELDHDDLIGLKRPKLDKKVIERLTADECRRLIAACAGKDFRERRDGAIVRACSTYRCVPAMCSGWI
jgi:site-specific recombinase XerD